MLDQVHLERMTSPEVRAALATGRTTVLIACGAVEQHGPHLPLFMDAEHGTRLAEEVARRMGNALVAPTIRVGCSEHHMQFAGSMSLRVTTFEALCQDYAVSLARHGFRRICFIPTHGGNFAPLVDMLDRLRRAVGDAVGGAVGGADHEGAANVRVEAFTDLAGMVKLWTRVVEEEAGLGSRVGGHADIAEGSIMLAIEPGLVREADAVAGYVGDLTPAVLERVFRDGIGAVTANGILGDARGMSEAIGRRCIAETAEMLVEQFGS
jgi:creatinine amidohydrolase